jgi:hypothetical protein
MSIRRFMDLVGSDAVRHPDRDALHEAKQVGVLYHFTDLHGAWAILDEAKLKIGDTDGSFTASDGGFAMTQPRTHISFTRNPRLPRLGQSHPWGEVRIAFDGDKLSSRHRISPYADRDHGITRHHQQAEEAIARDEIDIGGCVTQVDFNFFEWMRKATDWETWCAIPDDASRDRYTRQFRQEAAEFVKAMRNLGYTTNLVKKF